MKIQSFLFFPFLLFFLCSCASSPYDLYTYEDGLSDEKALSYFYGMLWRPGEDFEIVLGDRLEAFHLKNEIAHEVEISPILTGMTKKQLIYLWGPPTHIEIAHPKEAQNECWIYNASGLKKRVYFEAGRIDGWAL